MANAVTRGMDVAKLEPRAQTHDLAREHSHESLRGFRIALEFREESRL